MINDKKEEIIHTPDSEYNNIELPRDTHKLRQLFDLMPKPQIRQALCDEQHGLCAYCMRKIVPIKQSENDEEAKIEHYIPLSMDKKSVLEYSNFLGVCHGGVHDETVDTERLVLCCDGSRQNKELTIDPRNKEQMEAIAYRRDGYMFVKTNIGRDIELVKSMQRDINEVLHLNGELSKDGELGIDTTSRLIACRKRICDSVNSQLRRWDKKGLLTSEYVKEKLDELCKQLEPHTIADPFIGTRIYFMEKKYYSLVRQGK